MCKLPNLFSFEHNNSIKTSEIHELTMKLIWLFNMHAFAGVNYLYFDIKLMISISYIHTDKIVNHMLPRNKLVFSHFTSGT